MILIRRCPICLCELDRRNHDRDLRCVCFTCRSELVSAGAVSVAGVDHLVALWQYDDRSGPLLSAAKGRGGERAMRRLAGPLASALAPFLQRPSVVTWVPPSPRGRRRRGFDQGRLLAAGVGARLDVPVAPSFRRAGRAQFGAGRRIRLEGPRLSIRSDWVRRPTTDQILLIDDVMTTGTSMGTAAELLRRAQHRVDIVGAVLAVRH